MEGYAAQFDRDLKGALEGQNRQKAKNLGNFMKILIGMGVSAKTDPVEILNSPLEVIVQLINFLFIYSSMLLVHAFSISFSSLSFNSRNYDCVFMHLRTQ